MLRLALLFTSVTAVEMFLIAQLGALIGPWWTVALVIVTGTLGAWLVRREGIGLIGTLTEELNKGIPPGSRLMEGVLILVGGTLLITPGVLTDLTGFLLIAPPTRQWLAPRVLKYLSDRFQITGHVGPIRHNHPDGAPGRPDRDGPTPFSNPFDDLE